MILKESYSLEWIRSIQRQSGKDPTLIEKVIMALTLLEQLQLSGLNFIFKGGTALILLLGEPQRLSIDIDILVHPDHRDILPGAVESIFALGFFESAEEKVRQTSRMIPKTHYKFYYRSVVSGKSEPLLLDVLFEENPYTCTEALPICSSFVQCDENHLHVHTPSINCILGDKLTAFAPTTTGIPYNVEKELEIIKQLFDVAMLFDHMDELATIYANYDKIVRQELDYRGRNCPVEQVLLDTFEAAVTLSLRGQINPAQYAQLEAGVKKIRPFIFSQTFHLESAIRCASKAAYLSMLRLRSTVALEKFTGPEKVATLMITHTDYNKLNRLKKTDPEAFFYWCKAIELRILE